MKTLCGIQYLRAVAALAVVLFHAAERAGAHFSIGAAGVDIFFTVSGFIMVVISEKRAKTPAGFLKDRFLRIAPTYWIVTTVMVAGALAGLFPNLVLQPAHLIGSYAFIPVPSPSGGSLWPVLVQGWTLNYEMFFYLAFASTLLLTPHLRLPALAVIFGILALVGSIVPPEAAQLYFYTRPIILEFLIGALIGRFWLKGMAPRPDMAFILIALAMMSFATIYILQLNFSTWICGPLAIMLLIGILGLEKADCMPQMPALTYLGDASYSIYLWHTLAISVVLKAATVLSLPTWLSVLGGAVLGTVLGIFAYEFLERPLNSLLRHRKLTFRVPRRQPAK